MGKEELSYFQDEFSQRSPDNEPHDPRQQIFFSVSGNYFQRLSSTIKEQFPQIIEETQTQTRQVRLVALTEPDGYGLIFEPWNRDIHGEFEDMEKCPLKIEELQKLLENVALDTDQSINVFATYQDLRNARKQSGGASTKAVPKDRKIKKKELIPKI